MASEPHTERGFRWWVQYVVVPIIVALIGGGGIMGIAIAVLSNNTQGPSATPISTPIPAPDPSATMLISTPVPANRSCFEEYREGIPDERTIEQGAFDKDIFPPAEDGWNEPISLKFNKDRNPVGALKVEYFPNDDIVKIRAAVDFVAIEGQCSQAKLDPKCQKLSEDLLCTLRQFDGLTIEFGEDKYDLGLGFRESFVRVKFNLIP